MSPIAQLVVAAVTAGLPTLTVLISLLINNQRLTDVSRSMDQRFTNLERRIDETRDILRAEMHRMEQVMDARLKHLEERLAH